MRYDSGRGSDTYRSAGSSDVVLLHDDGRDVVSTGKRVDVVTVRHAGRPGSPQVSLGGSNDNLVLEVAVSHGRFDGGGQDDQIVFRHRSQEVWTLDNRRGRAMAGGEVRFRWRGFVDFSVRSLKVPELHFLGSAADELVDGWRSDAQLEVTTAGGDDFLRGGRADDLLDGGPGTDVADGSDGTDTCVAVETSYDCEIFG